MLLNTNSDAKRAVLALRLDAAGGLGQAVQGSDRSVLHVDREAAQLAGGAGRAGSVQRVGAHLVGPIGQRRGGG